MKKMCPFSSQLCLFWKNDVPFRKIPPLFSCPKTSTVLYGVIWLSNLMKQRVFQSGSSFVISKGRGGRSYKSKWGEGEEKLFS